MNSYQEFEKTIFNWLMSKHKMDSSFVFSLRQVASKGAERDYFIGKERSNYFGTTFWSIHVNYPGSSSDLFNLFFTLSDDEFDYYFYGSQTRNPYNEQNRYNLQLVKNAQKALEERFPSIIKSSPKNKMEFFKIKSRKTSYKSIEDLIKDVDLDLNDIITIVDKEIFKLKKSFPKYIAHRITQKEFTSMVGKMEKRQSSHQLGDDERILSKYEHDLPKINGEVGNENTENEPALNLILYGPPGTGKTYNTVNKSLEIIDESFDMHWPREVIKKEFDRLVRDGQIVFTTFHQSMTYEDFIEGIKPQKVEDGEEFLRYDVEQGIFKSLCNRARSIKIVNNKIDWESPKYYKMSLGGKDKLVIHDWCLENNVIAIGYGGNNDLSKFALIKNWQQYRDLFTKEFPKLVEESRFHIQATYTFLNMKKNDIVVVSKGNHVIDAIGVVKGGYYWDDKSPVDYYHFREVEWIAKNLNTSPDRFIKKQISQMSIYEFLREDIKIESFKELSGENGNPKEKRFVLIIDEINRGNISQIFGELITLIEDDKRLGGKESLEVVLPYSKEKFGVPSNVYIIGTMNTADRSVEALDTALRRRFSFEEILPKPQLISTERDDKGIFNGIDLANLLVIINKRIEKLLDKDHQIGHSYFLKFENNNLMSVFYNKIIPLLQEYFFGDYGKIGLVLGEGFINRKEWNNDSEPFANFRYDSISEFEEKDVYYIIDYRKEDVKHSVLINGQEISMTF